MNILYKIAIFILLSISLEATSLKELIDITLKNSNNIKSMDYLTKSAKETLKSVSNIYTPTLNVGASYSRLDIDVLPTQVGSMGVGFASFEVNLYDGGKNEAIKRQKNYEYSASMLNKNAFIKGLLQQVTTLFFQIKKNERGLDLFGRVSRY